MSSSRTETTWTDVPGVAERSATRASTRSASAPASLTKTADRVPVRRRNALSGASPHFDDDDVVAGLEGLQHDRQALYGAHGLLGVGGAGRDDVAVGVAIDLHDVRERSRRRQEVGDAGETLAIERRIGHRTRSRQVHDDRLAAALGETPCNHDGGDRPSSPAGEDEENAVSGPCHDACGGGGSVDRARTGRPDAGRALSAATEPCASAHGRRTHRAA